MKTKSVIIGITWLFSLAIYGQGFIFDQQSANESTGGGVPRGIQANDPIGQSFTPTLSSVGFIRLALVDPSPLGAGATIYINLRTDSITGPILSSSDSVAMPNGFNGYTDFFFSTSAAVIPGTIYYFQPVVQSGDAWTVRTYNSYHYPGGEQFELGNPAPNFDLWFREGIIVPEPSSISLLLLGGAVWIGCKKYGRK